MLQADFVKIWHVDDIRKELYRRTKDSLTSTTLHSGFSGYCCQTKMTVLFNDAADSKQFNREVDAPDPSLSHILASPICYLDSRGNALPRAVVIVSNKTRLWVEEDRKLLKLFSALVCRTADFVQ